MQLHSYSLLKIGGRSNVEDAIAPERWSPGMPPVWVVCDGVGGSNFGEVASSIASKIFYTHLTAQLSRIEAHFTQLISEALEKFHQELSAYLATHPGADNTSTTLTLAAISNGKIYTAWCGDSRIYLLRNGKPVFRSRDHSLVNEMVMQGVITKEEAITHSKRNIITRSLNAQTRSGDIETEVIDGFQQDDWLLLCTDGLLEQFTEERFSAVLNGFQPGTDYSARIDALCDGKTKDNYSMHLVHLGAGRSGKKGMVVVAGLVMLLLIGAAAYYFTQGSAAAGARPVPVDTSSHFLSVPSASKDSASTQPTLTDTVK